MLVAFWNIEKSGQTSLIEKQTKVNDFMDRYCANERSLSVDLLFLCEVHSARFGDYEAFVKNVYTNYEVTSFSGGYSNYYLVLMKKNASIGFIGSVKLDSLNRYFVVYAEQGCYLGLAHFKSGQTDLTKSQIKKCAAELEAKSTSNWALSGDLNWDYSKKAELELPAGSKAYTLWTDQSQKKGGILDWVINGKNASVAGMDLSHWDPSFFDMTGPDHRPVIFQTSVVEDQSKKIS